MTTSPYTHPSMPGTAPMVFDLSAALEDAEGAEMVKDIIARKRWRNIRERFIQQLVWGDVHTDGHGNVIPRQEPEHWSSLRAAYVEGGLDGLRGPMFHMAWEDEHLLMTHETGWRSILRVGGRGHGKTAAIEALRKWNSRPEAFIPSEIPPIASVRWVCASPTGHVSRSSLEEKWAQYTRDMVDGLAGRPYNRKLNARVADKVQAIHDILGVTPHGSNC